MLLILSHGTYRTPTVRIDPAQVTHVRTHWDPYEVHTFYLVGGGSVSVEGRDLTPDARKWLKGKP